MSKRPPRDPGDFSFSWWEEVVAWLLVAIFVAGVVAGLWLLVLNPIADAVRELCF